MPTPAREVIQYRVEDIRCHCLSFSTSAKPSLCTYLDAHILNWDTAYSFASSYDLNLQFASEETISKILTIRNPLPDSMLQSLARGEVKAPESSALLQSENKIICGLGDEVKRMGSEDLASILEVECHYIGAAIAFCMLFVGVYLAVRSAWIRYVHDFHCIETTILTTSHRLFGLPEGTIKLEGDEKSLLANLDQEQTPSTLR